MSDSMTGFGRKAVLVSLFVALLAIFAGVMVYRLNHPSLQEFVHQAPGNQETRAEAGPGGMPGNGMGQVREYMAQLEKNPEDFDALTGLGNAFLMMRAFDRASENLEKALAVRPDAYDVKGALGYAYFNLKRYEDSLRMFKEMVEARPDDAMAQFNLGVILKHGFQRAAEAESHFKAVLSIKDADEDLIKRARAELSGEKAE